MYQETQTQDLGFHNCPHCEGTGYIIKTVDHPHSPGDTADVASPCPFCTGSRRIKQNNNFPPNFHEAELQKFDFSLYKADISQMKDVVNRYFEKFPEMQKKNIGIYFHSKTPGAGKTFLSCCLGRSISIKYDLQLKFITVANYIDLVGRSYKQPAGAEDESEVYRNCSLLILDDIGAESQGSWQSQELFRLIDGRVKNGLITIYTSNLAPDALQIESRLINRIQSTTLSFKMPEESIRSLKADEEKERIIQELLS